MKILLIDPPYECLQNVKTTPNYPLGLAYLTSYLNKKGHEAIYLNMDWDPRAPSVNPFSYKDVMNRYSVYLKETLQSSKHPVWSNFAEALKHFKPDVVGISTNSIKVKSVFKLAEITKQIDAKIVTVLGGFHTQVFAEEILKNVKEIDFIILDEGEETLSEVVEALEKESKLRLNAIKGLVFRDKDNNVIFNERRPLMEDLDALPYPSHCRYYACGNFVKLPIEPLMASRGCIFNCNYCASNQMWQRKVRYRSPRSFVDEIKDSIAGQKRNFLSFYDDCFTLDKKWLLEFCDIVIKENIKINWQCITSVNLLEEAIFKKIVQANCTKINVGVESGSERILKQANKNIKLDDVKTIFNLSKKYRISTTAYIMLGFPTETEYDIRLTQNLIKDITPNWVYCNVFIPLAGTKYYEWLSKRNLIDSKNAWKGDAIKNIIMNYTDTLTNEKFLNLVDETFKMCYKINTRMRNMIKRAPIKSYIRNPSLAFDDLKRVMQYLKLRNELR